MKSRVLGRYGLFVCLALAVGCNSHESQCETLCEWADDCGTEEVSCSDDEIDECADDLDDADDDCEEAVSDLADCVDENELDCDDVARECQGESVEFLEQCRGDLF